MPTYTRILCLRTYQNFFINQPGSTTLKGLFVLILTMFLVQQARAQSSTCTLSATVTPGQCQTATNTYQATVAVSLANAVAGTLTVSIPGSEPLSLPVAANTSSFTAIFPGLHADGATHTATVTLPGCGTTTAQFDAPASCYLGVVSSLTATATPGQCQTATNTFTNVVVVEVTNSPLGTLIITDGPVSQTLATTAVSSATFTATFDGLVADGSLHTLIICVTGCTPTSVTYTAPTSCSGSVPEPLFDLALRKTLAANQPASVTPGSSVTFTVTVFNQGADAATDINLTDYIPAGLTLNDPNWLLSGSTAILNTPIASLAAGASTTRDIIFTVGADATGQLVNRAEISSATGGVDFDSTPDNDADNDAGGVPGSGSDDAINGNGSGAPGSTDAATDDDDADPAVITVTPSTTCSVSSVVTTPGLCNDVTNTHSATAVVALNNFTSGGVLTVTTGAQSQTVLLPADAGSLTSTVIFDNLPSDGATHTVTASLAGCGSATATYSAPASCSAMVCSVDPVVTAGLCATATNTYSSTITVTLTSPTAATLIVKDGDTMAMFSVPGSASAITTIAIFDGIISDGTLHVVTADLSGCGSQVITYTAPVSCSAGPACSMGTPTVTTVPCRSGSTFSATAVVSLSNPPAGVLTLTDGPLSVTTNVPSGLSNFTFTGVFVGLTGLNHTVTASLPGCSPQSATYTAPASCSVTSCIPPVATASAASPTCNTATQTANTDGQLLIWASGADRAAFSIGSTFTGTYASAQLYTGLAASGSNRILTNTLTSPASSQTYTIRFYASESCFGDRVVTLQPASCGCPPAQCLPVVVTRLR